MTNLMIDDVEAELLREVLQAQLVSLRVEISHADHREYRAQLQRRHEMLESLLRRIPVEVTVAAAPTTRPVL